MLFYSHIYHLSPWGRRRRNPCPLPPAAISAWGGACPRICLPMRDWPRGRPPTGNLGQEMPSGCWSFSEVGSCRSGRQASSGYDWCLFLQYDTVQYYSTKRLSRCSQQEYRKSGVWFYRHPPSRLLPFQYRRMGEIIWYPPAKYMFDYDTFWKGFLWKNRCNYVFLQYRFSALLPVS